MARSSEFLRAAHARLGAARSRVRELQARAESAGGSGAAPLASSLQAVRDCYQRIENDVLKLARLESAWVAVRTDLQDDWRAFEQACGSVALRMDAIESHGSEPPPRGSALRGRSTGPRGMT